MRNLLNFLARYTNLIIFIFLEGLSFYYLTSRNEYHNTQLILAVRGVTNGIEAKLNKTRSYLHLRDVNTMLAAENSALKENLQKRIKEEKGSFDTFNDTVFIQQYVHTAAEVINNSVDHQRNFFTINKGRKQGMAVDMSITSPEGVAGVIVGCSDNYSVAMSVLNIDFRLSARIKSSGYFGSLNWDGHNFSHAVLNEIPQHVPINVGDTIETTGYSAVFPEGVMVGTVSDFEKTGGDFYKIKVKLSTDFKKLHFVDVIGNLRKKEQLNLQSQFK